MNDRELIEMAQAGILADRLTLFFERLSEEHPNVDVGPWEAAKVAEFLLSRYDLRPKTTPKES
jgi:hypothetical protein